MKQKRVKVQKKRTLQTSTKKREQEVREADETDSPSGKPLPY